MNRKAFQEVSGPAHRESDNKQQIVNIVNVDKPKAL